MANITKPTGINKVWGATGTLSAPSDAKISLGWIAELPPFEWENYIQNRTTQWIAHANQKGIPTWDAITEYRTNTSYCAGSDGFIYKCISTCTNIDPVSDVNKATYWALAFDPASTSYSKSASDAKYLVKSNNLSDLTLPATARTNLGLGTASVTNTGVGSGNTMLVGTGGIGLGAESALYNSWATVDCNTVLTTKFIGINIASTNKPINQYGILEVIVGGSSAFCLQRFTPIDSLVTYKRYYVSSSWTAWYLDYSSYNFNPSTKADLTGASFSGDVTLYRTGATSTGVLYFGISGTRYLNYDGTNYVLGGSADLYINGGKAWANSNVISTLGTSGSMTLPNGLILKWGSTNTFAGSVNLTFPVAFPNNCFSITATVNAAAGNTNTYSIQIGNNMTRSGATIYSAAATNLGFFWVAIGN